MLIRIVSNRFKYFPSLYKVLGSISNPQSRQKSKNIIFVGCEVILICV